MLLTLYQVGLDLSAFCSHPLIVWSLWMHFSVALLKVHHCICSLGVSELKVPLVLILSSDYFRFCVHNYLCFVF